MDHQRDIWSLLPITPTPPDAALVMLEKFAHNTLCNICVPIAHGMLLPWRQRDITTQADPTM